MFVKKKGNLPNQRRNSSITHTGIPMNERSLPSKQTLVIKNVPSDRELLIREFIMEKTSNYFKHRGVSFLKDKYPQTTMPTLLCFVNYKTEEDCASALRIVQEKLLVRSWVQDLPLQPIAFFKGCAPHAPTDLSRVLVIKGLTDDTKLRVEEALMKNTPICFAPSFIVDICPYPCAGGVRRNMCFANYPDATKCTSAVNCMTRWLEEPGQIEWGCQLSVYVKSENIPTQPNLIDRRLRLNPADVVVGEADDEDDAETERHLMQIEEHQLNDYLKLQEASDDPDVQEWLNEPAQSSGLNDEETERGDIFVDQDSDPHSIDALHRKTVLEKLVIRAGLDVLQLVFRKVFIGAFKESDEDVSLLDNMHEKLVFEVDGKVSRKKMGNDDHEEGYWIEYPEVWVAKSVFLGTGIFFKDQL